MPSKSIDDTSTRSLRPSLNPQARMQELLKKQELDSAIEVPVPVNSDILTSSNQDSNIDSNLDRQQDEQIVSNTSLLIAGKSATLTERKSARQKVSQTNVRQSTLDPVDQALLQKLGRDYPNFAKEAFTLISSRLPNELVARLDAAASLVKKHKKNKQDVIARGLILAFEELVKSNGDVAWYE